MDARVKPGHDAECVAHVCFIALKKSYRFTYFCTRQFNVSATNTSPRGLTAM
jgi:hypothetical protein